ncbi:MDR/zinc-dependent alcohol dehydrogenase-like family protein [Anaeromyxobacter diazotrophicus]|uniref:Oxidoreductase n=1 Tax=Anaeromyxobacter diazotrophicus TaxID=2590199 RepID=A0A7I9VQD8_9BACT|nr:zinc-binding dehydrogenase [Anaeromyxobacter diazotrophicus]GEJ58299.1 oxidoreductase [Anaeromyxobacter diazotrophicus]
MDPATSPRPRRAQRMRAAVLAGPGRLELADVARPEPGPGQVRIRLEGSGLCGSNLPVFEGRPWFSYPLAPGAPGHEGWGRVDAAGAGVRALSEGDRVACLGAAAFADYEVVDAAAAVKLPRALDGAPFPGEPLACAVNAFRRSGVEAGQAVAVVGVGFLGAVLTALAAGAGARVVAVGRRPSALEVARRMGAAEVVPLGELWPTFERVKAAAGGRMLDVAIEAAGAQLPLDLAGELVRERGRLVIAGYHQDGTRTVNLQSWNWRGIDVVNAHERNPAVYAEGMRLAVAAVAEGRLDPRPLYTHAVALERIGEAFAALRDRPEGFMKALVTM